MWRVQPLYITILEILEKKNSITDAELLEMLKNTLSYREIGFSELNKVLMKMEIAGLISVSPLTKGKRLVQLIKR